MYKIKLDKQETEFETSYQKDQLVVNDKILDWDITPIDENSFHIITKAKTYTAHVVSVDYESKAFTLKINGKTTTLSLKDKMDLLLEKLGMSDLANSQLNDLKAPMPGLIADIIAQEGDEVQKGDSLLILEAMKMENVIKATGEGTIKSIKIKKGESVEKNQLLIEF